ncbi:hypothetical protein ACFXPX_03350 [Kitasatospora sp. NPDC059146]|uniref:hypothetical protein n=1 Tax=unclassified Kitasatospora TaxID=2633591 RepID=UPI0036BAEE55
MPDLAPRFTGLALYGSCYQQCVANLLDWQGVPAAEEAVGMSWGFSRPGGAALDGSGRWLAAAGAGYGLDVADLRFADPEQAGAYERESLAAGVPVAAAVDAFHLPSPFEGKQHITHCVIAVAADADGVVVVDPMNNPEPVRYRPVDWARLRSGPSAQDSRLLLVRSGPTRRPGPVALARQLGEQLRAHDEQDAAALADHLAADATGAPDVSGVAAERMYLARFLAALARPLPELRPVAEGLAALERRWYLAHTIALESGGVPPQRQLRLVRDLGERDQEQRRAAAELLSAIHRNHEEDQ